jgi:hypothetical protein
MLFNVDICLIFDHLINGLYFYFSKPQRKMTAHEVNTVPNINSNVWPSVSECIKLVSFSGAQTLTNMFMYVGMPSYPHFNLTSTF